MPFLDDFNDNPNDGEKGGVLETQLRYRSDKLGCTITLEPGTASNYGNVPWFGQLFVPRGAEYRPAYYVHDEGYKRRGYLISDCVDEAGFPRRFTRAEMDGVMLEAMHDLKPKPWWKKLRANIAWTAVRMNLRAALYWNREQASYD